MHPREEQSHAHGAAEAGQDDQGEQLRKGNQKPAERKDSSQGGCKDGKIKKKTSVDVLRRQQDMGKTHKTSEEEWGK